MPRRNDTLEEISKQESSVGTSFQRSRAPNEENRRMKSTYNSSYGMRMSGTGGDIRDSKGSSLIPSNSNTLYSRETENRTMDEARHINRESTSYPSHAYNPND